MNGPVPIAVRRRSPFSTASRATIADQPPAMPARSEALGCLVTMRTVWASGTSMCSMALRYPRPPEPTFGSRMRS